MSIHPSNFQDPGPGIIDDNDSSNSKCFSDGATLIRISARVRREEEISVRHVSRKAVACPLMIAKDYCWVVPILRFEERTPSVRSDPRS